MSYHHNSGQPPLPSIVTPPPHPQSSHLANDGRSPSASSSIQASNNEQIRLQILASLFPPNSANGNYIAHLKTWEDVPGSQNGSVDKKPRYVLLAVQPDGRVKIHKSKRNTNGTFSIGKTWNLEELKALEVHKPRRPSAQGPSITCFTITINSKSYLWETESGRQQDDFLVTLVRAYRQCTGGASPRLTGFQVGEIPGAPPAYEVPVPGQGGQYASGSMASPNRLPPPSASSASMNNRPGTANSTMSNESSFYAQQQQQHQQQLSPADPIAGGVTSPSATSPLSPAALAMRKKASNSSMNSVGSASSSVRPNARPPLPSGGPRPTQQPQILSSPSKSAVPPSSRSGTPTPTSRQDGHYPSSAQQQGSYGSAQPSLTVSSGSPRPRVRDLEPSQATSSPPRKLSVPTSTADETNRPLDSTAAANAALLLLGQGGSQRKNSTASSTGRGGGAEGNEDSDIMLTNVEEMLEGIEWGNSGQNGHGQSQGQHSADMIEKRLLGELNALEAAGIHAIIESDDRVNDVVKYLDSALAELDRMDQMLSLYKTHLNAVADDMNHIEGQNKGLQIQSSNQRALLAELDRVLGR